MRLLVTNDDGIVAPGLRFLAGAAREHGFEVVVAAPAREASGMSAALTAVAAHGRVVFEQTPAGFAVAASPAYIVMLASLGVFGPPPEIVLSGINRGANIGRSVLHSGTVGAALTAANQGARALAVSLDVLVADPAGVSIQRDDDLHWATAADAARGLLDWLAEAPPGTVVNVNVPDRPVAEVAGRRAATLADFGQVRMAVAEVGAGFAQVTLERSDPPAPGSDTELLAQGFVTMTALRPVAAIPGARLPAPRTATDRPDRTIGRS